MILRRNVSVLASGGLVSHSSFSSLFPASGWTVAFTTNVIYTSPLLDLLHISCSQ